MDDKFETAWTEYLDRASKVPAVTLERDKRVFLSGWLAGRAEIVLASPDALPKDEP